MTVYLGHGLKAIKQYYHIHHDAAGSETMRQTNTTVDELLVSLGTRRFELLAISV